uniref:Derlin n=1 Tax=Craspedostauros australis TaxID=1486917 RepID=A0A7R9WSN7_9STRA|mmetsp:Transcript_1881/g.5192  ORF Transcript_1881/g.5192 Transcript_1881/m.5192 type:complete len:274 (+) Transcript_1881:243-1064(+)
MPFAQPGNGEVNNPAGPDQWFNSLPFVTRYWFGATMIVTLSANFGIVSIPQVMYDWSLIKNNFEIWRFLTSFCFVGPFQFNTLISAYMLVQFSKQYEAGGPFNTGAGGGTADYAFCLIFGAVAILLTFAIFPLDLPPVFSRNLIYYVLYVWSKRHPTSQANIWGIPMAANYLPFAYLALTVFMGSSWMDMLHGLAVGHLYYFLVDVVPAVYGKQVLTTPNFLLDYFGVGEYTPEVDAPPAAAGAGGGRRVAAAPPAAQARHQWGTGGQRLGTQ